MSRFATDLLSISRDLLIVSKWVERTVIIASLKRTFLEQDRSFQLIDLLQVPCQKLKLETHPKIYNVEMLGL